MEKQTAEQKEKNVSLVFVMFSFLLSRSAFLFSESRSGTWHMEENGNVVYMLMII